MAVRAGRVRQRAWKPRDVKAVLDVRRKHPFMGKARIQAVLTRKGRELSVSTVGRIIERALAAGAIRPASFCEGRVKPRRRRRFAKWARRWKYGAKATRAGKLVQVDHMTYTCEGRTLKEYANRRFDAVCPVSRFMATRVFTRATAGRTLRAEARDASSRISSAPCRSRCCPSDALPAARVEGGSEFMADFEEGCEELRIPLRPPAVGHVLPPRRPQWNGCVERANRSARAEFWNLYDGPLTVEHVAPQLARYEFFYNYERPHASLAYRTPNEYLVAQEAA